MKWIQTKEEEFINCDNVESFKFKILNEHACHAEIIAYTVSGDEITITSIPREKNAEGDIYSLDQQKIFLEFFVEWLDDDFLECSIVYIEWFEKLSRYFESFILDGPDNFKDIFCRVE